MTIEWHIAEIGEECYGLTKETTSVTVKEVKTAKASPRR